MASKTLTPSTYSLQDYSLVAEHEDTTPPLLGTPTKKKRFERVHVIATALSWICLIVAYITITSHLRLAWLLRFDGQIIVIGLLLGIMNLCTSTVLPYTFLLLEARFGRSSLQNYEALLTSHVLSPGANLIWRLALSFFVVLPLGLSVAYKRFLGGHSSADITIEPPGQYGIDFPRIGTWAPPNDAIYLLTTSINPFLAASQYQALPFPAPDEFPQPYGYNTLLLSGNAAAILDIPTKSYVARAQAAMAESPGEEWNITATVNAYVAVRNTVSDFQTNDNTWYDDMETSLNLFPPGLSGGLLYEGAGVCIGVMPAGDNDQCFIGVYPNSTVEEGFQSFTDPSADYDYVAFRPYARQFDISRKSCSGRWKLNSTSIVLLGGSCDLDSSVDSSVLQAGSMVPYPYDLLPELHYVFLGVANTDGAVNFPILDPWLDATYAVTVATAWWARALYILYGEKESLPGYGALYDAKSETVISTRPTLKALPLLYVVLAVQPVITLVALLVAAGLYTVPVGRGFGIVSILSGFDPPTSQNIRGAGLSGILKKQIGLEVVADTSALGGDSKVVYRLTSLKSQLGERTQLQKNLKYS